MSDTETLPQGTPWQVLGLEPGPEEGAVRRAYAGLIRRYRPDSHPAEFMRVREAYEHALALARQLRWEIENEANEAAEEGGDAPAAQPVVAEPPVALPETAQPEAVRDTQPAPIPWLAETPVEEPEPAFAAFDAEAALGRVAAAYNEHGELASVEALHAQLAESAKSTIDARLDFEWHLVRSLLTTDAPPLGLLFEGNRCFRWTERFVDLENQVGPAAARRLVVLVELSEQWVYMREYSPNPWGRRLFAAPDARLPRFGLQTQVLGARGAAEQWLQSCAEAELPNLQGRLNPLTLRRLEPGRLVHLPDLVFAALLGGSFVEDMQKITTNWLLIGLGVLAFMAVVLGLCMTVRSVPRWLGAQRYAKAKTMLTTGKYYFWVFGTLFAVAIVMAAVDAGDLGWKVLGIAMLVFLGGAFLALLLVAYWMVVAMVEGALLAPWTRLTAASAHRRFTEMRAQAAGPWAPPAVGFWQSLPAMWRDWQAERPLRKAQAKARAEMFPSTTASWLSRNAWWVGIAAVLAINASRALFR